MKDLGKPKYRSLLQLEHLHSYIMVYYVVYIHIGEIHCGQILSIHNSHGSSFSRRRERSIRPRDDGNEILGLNVP